MERYRLQDIIGHATSVELLRRALRTGRIASGYLFSGTPGIGRSSLALAFAAALNCTDRTSEDACGNCSSCRKVAAGTHPDVLVVEPEGATFRVDQVREVCRQMALAPVEGRYKVAVLLDVEAMRPEAANALLKTLEEPPGDGVLLLVTANVHGVLPTVRSRCQPIPLRPMPIGALADVLKERGASPESARRIALAAQGRIGVALKLAEEGHQPEPVLPEVLDETPPTRLFQIAEEWAQDPAQLDLLLTWCRDLLLARLGVPSELWTYPESAQALNQRAQSLSVRALIRKMRGLMEGRYRLLRNANPTLTMESLAFLLAGSGEGGPSRSKTVP